MKIFGYEFGRKDNAATPPPQNTEEQKVPAPKPGEIGFASSHLYGAGSWIRYNPDDLIANKGYKIYRKMLLDDQVKACLRFKQYSVISRDYYFDVAENDETGEPDEQQKEMADFFEAVIAHIRGSWSDKLIEILSALESGYSITEKVYEPFTWNERTMWGIRDIKLRPFETFSGGITTDQHGNIEKIEQVSGGAKVELPLGKIIHFVYQPDRDLVFGESDLRACYRAWWSKDITIKMWNIFLERMAGGFTHATVKGSLSPAQESDLQSVVKNVGVATGIITPDTVEIEQTMPKTTTAYRDAIASHDKAISKSLLVPNLLGISEQDSVGSYSQSQTQFDTFMFVLDHIGKCLEEALNEQLFRELAIWNFGTEDFPAFRFEEMSEERKQKIATTWADMVSKGAVTKSDTDEAYIRRILGMPEKAEEDEIDDTLPGDGEIFPINGGGQDEEEQPDNEEIIEEIPDEEMKANVRKMFASKPWMRRVNFTAIKKEMDRGDQALTDDLNDLLGQARLAIEKQIASIVGDRSLGNVDAKDIDGIKIPAGILSAMRKTLKGTLQDTLNTAYDQAKRELPRRKMAVPYRPGMDKTKAERFLQRRAMSITDVVNSRVLQSVKTVIYNGIRYDKSLGDTMKALREDTDLIGYLPDVDAAGRPVNVPARLENIVRTNTAYAWNEARQALFTDPDMRGFVQAFEYSAILDDRTSEVCQQLDGKIQKDWGGMTPPNHFQALPAGTMITVHGGQRAIEDIRPGDRVLTHAHNFMPVTETMRHDTWPEEIVIHLDGGRTLTLTDDHPVLTARGWVCAGDLTAEDSVMSLIGPCEICGKLTTNFRFCSNECKAKGNEIEAHKTCAHCGKKFKGHNRMYCSRECALAAGRRYCQHCGSEIKLKGKKKNHLYCSQKCMGEAMRTLPEMKCLNCGKAIRGKWKAPVFKERRFCSQKCYMAYKGETSIEETVREYLAINHIRAQRQYQIGRYFADLYLPDFNLVIEVDGEYWHGKKAKPGNVIETRERYIAGQGYAILHLPESAIKSGRYQRKIMEALHEIQATASKNNQHRTATL